MSIRVLSTPITGSALARIAIEGAGSSWFAPRPASTADWTARAHSARASLLSQNWLAELAPAIAATGKAAKRLERAAKSGIAVTAGQQPGLFGGPLYTWWKALSTLALADRLEAVTGLPVVPIFWAATDDSDFAEASYTVVHSGDGVERIEMAGDPQQGTPMCDVPVGDLSPEIARIVEAAGSGSSSAVLDVVRAAYSPGHTVGSAYVEMLRAMLEPLGIPVLDAAHVAVRTAAYPLLRRSLERAAEIEAALSLRAREIKKAGYFAQVKLVKGRTLVFGGYGGTRDRVRLRDVEEALATGAPDSFGPNVLLRPVVERSIIPTVAYMGGPAEIAYFAQSTAVAEALGVPAPLVVPRWSGMVIEPRIDKILARYNLSVEDFRDPHAVETRIARDSLPEEVKKTLSELKESVATSSDALLSTAGADLVPPTVIEGLQRSVNHRVGRVERRFAASVKRRGNDALRDAAIARGALYPLGTAQERALNFVPLIARYGDELISAVMQETRKHADSLT